MRVLPWFALAALALLASPAVADSPVDDGKKAFSAGVTLLADPDGARYEEAAAQFQRAFSLTGSWKVLGNLGLCQMKLERDGEAIETYDRYLFSGGKDIAAEERAQVQRDVDAMKASIVRVHVEVPAAGTIVDTRTPATGAKVLNKYQVSAAADLGVRPGSHVFVFRSAQGDSTWEVDLTPGSTASHKFEPGATTKAAPVEAPKPAEVAPAGEKPAAPSGSSQKTIGLVVAGVGVVGLAAGTFLGLSAKSKYDDEHKACDDSNLCDSSDARSRGNVATVVFGVGAAALVGGVVLFFTAPSDPAKTSRISIAPVVGTNRVGLATGVTF